MKSPSLLFLGLTAVSLASELPPSTSPPKGVSASDWSGIRAAYQAGRHAIHRETDGTLTARNPGQQWNTEFDGKGFTVTPDHGQWTWGLELIGYGGRTLSSASSSISHDGGKLTCPRDENLTEWFINDTRGLEQGWTIQSRSVGSFPTSENLTLTLALRGNLFPQVSNDGSSVSFHTDSSNTALTYGGLKAWDADGKNLTVRFEQAGEDTIRVAVDEKHARYPITIDPLAQQAYIKASNTEGGDNFGLPVAVSGDTIAVAARAEDSGATGVNGNQANNSAANAGAVYVFVRNEGAWTQQAYLKASNTGAEDFFGISIALSGDSLIVGAYTEDGGGIGVNPASNEAVTDSGAAYVFVRNGTTWTQQAYFKASSPGASDYFGWKVAISGDTAVVGAIGEDGGGAGVNPPVSESITNSGAAYVYVRNGTVWTQQAYLKASAPESGDSFGSVAVSGDTIIIGAPGEDSSATGIDGDQINNSAIDSGAVYVFVRNNGVWNQQAYLKSTNSGASDYFGNFADISGDTIIIGAFGEDGSGIGINPASNDSSTDAGAAYIFIRSASVWSQQAYLKASNNGAGDFFGYPVSISGDMAVVGAYREDSSANGIDGNGADNSATDAGAAYVYLRSGGSWSQLAYLKGSNTGAGDNFGVSVAVSSETVVIGAWQEDGSGTGINPASNESADAAGAAYVFVGLGPEILVKGPTGEEILSGGGSNLGGVIVAETGLKTFTVRNTGTAPLDVIAITPGGGNALDFNTSLPLVNPLAPYTETTFTVAFTPALGGPRSTALAILSNDVDEPTFDINLSGTGLTFTADTDLDGLNDASESRLSDLGFDWNTNQSGLVATYYAAANGAGLYDQTQYDANRLTGRQDVIGAPNTYSLFDQAQYDAHRLTGRQDVIGSPNTYNLFTPSQLQALKPETPLIARDPVTGKFTLTMDWKKSTDLAGFSDFPAPVGSAVSINPEGDIEFEFATPDPAAFFRIEVE